MEGLQIGGGLGFRGGGSSSNVFGGLGLRLSEDLVSLGDCGLLFFERLLEVDETLSGFGLGGGGGSVGEASEFVGAGVEGLDCGVGASLRFVEGLDLGGVGIFELGDAPVRGLGSDLGLGDVGLRGGDLVVHAGEGGTAGFDGLQILLGLGASVGGFSVGLFQGEFSFGQLGGGGGIVALGGLGVGDGLGDVGEACLGGGFADGERGLNLGGGFLGGGDVDLQGFFGGVFTEGLLRKLLEFRVIGNGYARFAGGRSLGEVDPHCSGEAELDAFAGGDEAGLQFGDLGEVAALADLQFVILGAVDLDCRRCAADGFAIEADGGGGRARRHDDGIDVGRIDGGIAAGDCGTQDEKGDRDTHGYGWGVRIACKFKSVSTPNHLISLRVDMGGL